MVEPLNLYWYKSIIIIIIIIMAKRFVRSGEGLKPSRPHNCWDKLEYWNKSRRAEKTWCHSVSWKPQVTTGMQLHRVYNNNNNNEKEEKKKKKTLI